MKFSDHTKIRKENFGTVVFDTLTEKIFVTDRIGGEILEPIAQGKDLPQIVSALAADYGCDAETIETDVLDFTGQLKVNKIIVQ